MGGDPYRAKEYVRVRKALDYAVDYKENLVFLMLAIG